jgi:hypothetical protein
MIRHVFVTHHKTGHHLCHDLAEAYCQRLGWTCCDVSLTADVPAQADVIVYESSLREYGDTEEYRFESYGGDLGIQPLPFKGVHTIRHPYEVIASAYRWHRKIDRPWLHEEFRGTGKSYKQHLESADGLAFEMRAVSRGAILNMYRFPAADPRFLTLRLEDFAADYDGTVVRLARHLELPAGLLLETSAPFNLRTMATFPDHVTRTRVDDRSHVELFEPHHYALFRETFPADLLAKLGYEGGPAV